MNNIVEMMASHTLAVSIAVVWTFAWAFACAALANRIDRNATGFVLGLLFGPVGVIFTACMVFGRPKEEPRDGFSYPARPMCAPRIKIHGKKPVKLKI